MSDNLRVGIVADNPNFPNEWDQIVEKVRIADELGYDSAWLGETWGYDIFTSLGDLVRATKHIRLGVGIANVFSRSPGVIASTIATLDERSGGRMILGLGASGPQVIEHWHGIKYEKPLRRVREYAEIINMIIAREPLTYNGEIFQLERGFKLRFKPVRSHIPVYIASLTPKSIAQAGEIADGILPTFWPITGLGNMRSSLDEGAAKANKTPGSTIIAEYLTTALIQDESHREIARRLARAPIAWYIGRMGTFYADMLRRNGYQDDVENVLKGWKSGPDAASQGVSDALLDATAIIGTPQEMAKALHEWHAAGVNEPLISMPQGDIEQTRQALAALKESL